MKQQDALDIITAGYNVFLTGPAGSGKTYVLNQAIQKLRAQGLSVGVTASTGIAATHLQGVTIHSWSGIGVRDQLTEWDIDSLMQKEFLQKRYEKTDVLIIDEISMLHARQLVMVDYLAQAFRRDIRPFGGMQVILCGDFFQLPPINRTGDTEIFVMQSDLWSALELKICYLDEQHRQHDQTLLSILHDIRSNAVSDETTEILRSRIDAAHDTDITPTKLYTHNADVDQINNGRLAELETESRSYTMITKGRKALVQSLIKSSPASEVLELKVGAQVMFIKNDPAGKFVNGTRGIVTGFSELGLPMVELADGRQLRVETMDWTIDDNGKKLATITQIPLKLAWAITVHKSQGMSLDCAEVDLSKAFEPGMGYVALSRVRSLDGLVLRGFNNTALTVNEAVGIFDLEIKKKSLDAAKNIKSLLITPPREYDPEKVITASSSSKIPSHIITRDYIEEGYTVEGIAKKRGCTLSTVINHIEKLVSEESRIDFDVLLPDTDANETIREAFETLDTAALKPVYEHLHGRFTYPHIRLVRAWMRQLDNE